MRTDSHNNPTAFTTGIAEQAGLILGKDYIQGERFPNPSNLVTARLLGDPIAITIKVIDKIGYYTKAGLQRWDYIAIPKILWDSLSYAQKRDVIGAQYKHEGGVSMRDLFPNYSISGTI